MQGLQHITNLIKCGHVSWVSWVSWVYLHQSLPSYEHLRRRATASVHSGLSLRFQFAYENHRESTISNWKSSIYKWRNFNGITPSIIIYQWGNLNGISHPSISNLSPISTGFYGITIYRGKLMEWDFSGINVDSPSIFNGIFQKSHHAPSAGHQRQRCSPRMAGGPGTPSGFRIPRLREGP